MTMHSSLKPDVCARLLRENIRAWDSFGLADGGNNVFGHVDGTKFSLSSNRYFMYRPFLGQAGILSGKFVNDNVGTQIIANYRLPISFSLIVLIVSILYILILVSMVNSFIHKDFRQFQASDALVVCVLIVATFLYWKLVQLRKKEKSYLIEFLRKVTRSEKETTRQNQI